MKDKIPEKLEGQVNDLKNSCKLLEVGRADFGVLFQFMDVFIVHGGLGTTVEALRMKKPTTVTGPLLMDQRFWGDVCYKKGVGMPATHVDNFDKICVEFVNNALDPDDPKGLQKNARDSDWGDCSEDGVAANANYFMNLITDTGAR